jgi:ribosomal protein L29
MKVKEVRELAPEEVDIKVVQLRRQLLEMKMQLHTNPGAVKPTELGKLRKTVARLLTVQQERRGLGHE